MEKETKAKLPKAFKNRWIKALRSGKFKQGTSSLKSEDDGVATYCCLGVAGHICGVTDFKGQGYLVKGEGIKGISKVPDLIKGGEDGDNPNELATKLASMNDTGKSFTEIADNRRNA